MTTLREAVRSSLLRSIKALGLPDQEETALIHEQKQIEEQRYQGQLEAIRRLPLPNPHPPIRRLPLPSPHPLQAEMKKLKDPSSQLARLRSRWPLPPSRGTFDLASSESTDQLVTLNRQVKADGGTLHIIVLSVEPSQVHQSFVNQSSDTALIASRLQDVYHEVRSTPSQLVHLDLAKVDAVLPAHAAATLPYPKAEKLVERLLFDLLSMEHRRCKTNLSKLDGEQMEFTVMSEIASRFEGGSGKGARGPEACI